MRIEDQTECMCNDCNNKAELEAYLSLRVHPKHPPALSSPLLRVCSKHIGDLTWNNLVTEDNWKRVTDMFAASGLQRPKKKHSKLLIRPII